MANQFNDERPILVTGATGKTGRRVAARLRAAGHAVRLGSRSADPGFGWQHRATWGPALMGTRVAYVAFQPDVSVPGALETVTVFFAQAVRQGVEHLVLLSGRGEIEAEHAEAALRESGADWTILRASWFHQNFSEGAFTDAILGGELALPVGSVAEPFVDAEDIADIAFAALTKPGNSGELHEITGPRALTFAEAVAMIGRASGREIAFRSVSPEDYRAELVGYGMPAAEVELYLYLFTTILDGRNTPVKDGVARALGRPAGDFADYARRTTATGVWGKPSTVTTAAAGT